MYVFMCVCILGVFKQKKYQTRETLLNVTLPRVPLIFDNYLNIGPS